MLSLPVEITVPCPFFSHVGIDLAGPLEFLREKAGMATRRTPGLMSVEAVLYVCLNTNGVKVLVRGFSTEDFLLNLDVFAADHGQPQSIHCDRGLNLVAGAKAVGEEG